MLVAVLCLGLGSPTPFANNAFFQNETGRFVSLTSQPSLGKLKEEPLILLSTNYILNKPLAECMWGSYKGTAFLGSPPKVCRRGKRIDGSAKNGRAIISVQGPDGIEVDVTYPAKIGSAPRMTIGPFKACTPGAVRGNYDCEAEEFTAIETFQNMSSVWVHDKGFLAQATLFQFMGLIQAVLFATMAARGKSGMSLDAIAALAADAAASGALTQAFLLGVGRSIVGLDAEVGMKMATVAELAITAWTVSLAACAYVHASAFEADTLWPHLKLGVYTFPFKIALRELCEIPLLVSLVIIWPENSGPHFLIQLQFMCGLVVSYIAGRAAGLVQMTQQSRGSRYKENLVASVFLLLGGIATGTVLCLGTVAASGAVSRGSVAITFTVVLQIHAACGGYSFGANSRWLQMQKGKPGGSEEALI